MPELPEVETICNGLNAMLPASRVLNHIVFHRKDLRFPLPVEHADWLHDAHLHSLTRRGKYLLFEWNNKTGECGFLINHLGMTGSWRRLAETEPVGKHDHVCLHWTTGEVFAYRDPRRFGSLQWSTTADGISALAEMGPEPLEKSWTSTVLHRSLEKRSGAIKQVLLDQKCVAGLGNIYVCEALFRAGIAPDQPASSLTPADCTVLYRTIRAVLRKAIKAGGSTISDFVQTGGGTGYFQHDFRVYGREGEPCSTCGTAIQKMTIAGRGTWWCPVCQPAS